MEPVIGLDFKNRDYCALVAIVIENAFNSRDWVKIIEELERKHFSDEMTELVKSYLTNKKLQLAAGGERTVSCGVLLGSVLGPLLWNLVYDNVLKLEMAIGTRSIAFADDLALLTAVRSEEELAHITNVALKVNVEWMGEEIPRSKEGRS